MGDATHDRELSMNIEHFSMKVRRNEFKRLNLNHSSYVVWAKHIIERAKMSGDGSDAKTFLNGGGIELLMVESIQGYKNIQTQLTARYNDIIRSKDPA